MNRSETLLKIFLALWGVFCLLFFLLNHPIENFSGIIKPTFSLRLFKPLLPALGWFFLCWGSGIFLFHFMLKKQLDGLFHVLEFHSLAVMLGFVSIGGFIHLMGRIFSLKLVIGATLLVASISALLGLKSLRAASGISYFKNQVHQKSTLDKLLNFGAIMLILCCLIGPFMRSLLPVTSHDALSYHLPSAKQWIQNDRIISTEMPFTFRPLLVSVHFVAFLLIKDDQACGSFSFLLYIALLGLMVGFGLRKCLFSIAYLPAIALASVPEIGRQASQPQADIPILGLALCMFIIFSSIPKFYSNENKSIFNFSILIGLFFGGLSSVKLLGLQVGTILFIIFEGFDRFFMKRSNLKKTLIVSAFFLIFFFPWFIATWLKTGNPFFPHFHSFFGESQNRFDFSYSAGFLDRFGFGHSIPDLALAIPRVFLISQIHNEQFGLKYFDGLLNPVLLILVPLLLFSKSMSSEGKKSLSISGILGILWLLYAHQARWIFPMMLFGVLSLLEIESISKSLKLFAAFFITILVIFNLFWWNSYLQDTPVKKYFEGELDKEKYLEQKLPFYKAFKRFNNEPRQGKLFPAMEERIYHLNKPFHFCSVIGIEFFNILLDPKHGSIFQTMKEMNVRFLFLPNQAFWAIKNLEISPEARQRILDFFANNVKLVESYPGGQLLEVINGLEH